MRIRNLTLLFSVLLLTVPLSARPAGKLTVYTVNYPLRYFSERIGGEHIDVHFPAPVNVDPAFWSPNVETIAAYQRADLIILNGANYAQWVGRVSLPRLRLVDTSSSFSDRLITEQSSVTHSHGPGGEHAHSGTAFTTWLDFNQAIQQARAILEELQRKRPDAGDYFAENFKSLEQDLLALDTEMLSLSEKVAGRLFMASHPIYQYLARRYRLNIDAMIWEPDKFPSEEQWQRFSQRLQQQPVQWILWEGEPLEKTRQRLSEMEVSVVVFGPCMNVPAKGNFLTVMWQNVQNLRKSIELGLKSTVGGS